MPHTVPSTTSAKSNRFDKPIVLPPSPPKSVNTTSPSVLALLEFFRLRRDGHIISAWNKPWNNLRLSLEEYDEFRTLLKNDDDLWRFVLHKVRYDWNPRELVLTIRMPTAIHEIFLTRLVLDIEIQRTNIAHNLTGSGLAATIAKQIYAVGSTDRFYPGSSIEKRSPDAQWSHEAEDVYPSVIIEVSYGQKTKNLSRLAKDYITRSRGFTKMVVGFDIEYRGTKEARIMVWRPNVTTQDGKNVLRAEQTMATPFRNADGKSLPGDFVLRLDDFAYPKSFQNASEAVGATPISIPHETLVQWLEEGEARDLKIKESRAQSERNVRYPDGYPEDIEVIHEETSSEEELGSLDEAVFRDEEATADRRRSGDDASYRGAGEGDAEIRRSSRIAQ